MRTVVLACACIVFSTFFANAMGPERGFDATFIADCEAGEEGCAWDIKRLGLRNAAVVTRVECGSAADKAGLRIDDIILSINGVRVDEMDNDQFGGAISLFNSGDPVILFIAREHDGEIRRRAIKFAVRFFGRDGCVDA